jgi:Na+/H+ antiporter NhaD/arsenite permease-like protein
VKVGALESSGLLKTLAVQLSDSIGNLDVIAAVIGLASAVVDNVPLVAATMGMYSLDQYATDDQLWQLIAYCAGTGGSILVIGSASGVALMGLEKVEFLWYLKKVLDCYFSCGAYADSPISPLKCPLKLVNGCCCCCC